jgi:hypothetical protein
MHGDHDGLVNVAQSARLHEALLGVHQDSQLLLVAGADHQSEAFRRPPVLSAVAEFFLTALQRSALP